LTDLIFNFRHQIKGISCSPYFDEQLMIDSMIKNKVNGGKDESEAKMEVYKSLPNERITKETYEKMMSVIRSVKVESAPTDEIEVDMYCDGDMCVRR